MVSFKKTIIFIIGYFLCSSLWAQSFPVDTSFTLHSAFQKEVKYRSYIKPVKPVVPPSVEAHENVVYVSYGQRDMHLDIYHNKNIGEDKPLVVFIHGGGWSSGNKTMEAPLAIYLAQKGFITASIEYRLSPEAKYPAGVIDVKTAIRWLRKNAEKFHINPDKVAVSGTSSGAQMASLIATTGRTKMYVDNNYPGYSNTIQALVNIDGVLAFLHPLSSEGLDKPGKPSAATRWFGSNSSHSKVLWEEASALNHVDQHSPPTLFINSMHPRFHAGRDDMIQLMDSLNIYSEVHEIPDTPHTFWLFDPWFDQTASWIETFLKKQL